MEATFRPRGLRLRSASGPPGTDRPRLARSEPEVAPSGVVVEVQSGGRKRVADLTGERLVVGGEPTAARRSSPSSPASAPIAHADVL